MIQYEFSMFPSTRTNNKGLFKLGSMFIVPGWSADGVDGASAGAEQWRFCFTQGAAFPARGADRREESVQRVLTSSTGTKKKILILISNLGSS